MALVGRPELVFLDEPTAGMDPQARRTTWDLIRRLRRDGVSVVLTTHFLDEAEQLADNVVVMDAGRVVAEGSPAELTRAGLGGPGPVQRPAGLPVADCWPRCPPAPGRANRQPGATWSGPRSTRSCWPRSPPGAPPTACWPRA